MHDRAAPTPADRQRRALLARLAAASAWGFAGRPDAAVPAWQPAAPVRLLVSFPPGAGGDAVARRLGAMLSQRTGVAFVVDNRPGGHQLLAVQALLRAPADGHALLVATEGVLTTLAHQFRTPPLDPWRELQPVGPILRTPLVLVCHPSVPATDVAGLARHGRAHPRALSYASWGVPLSVAYPELLRRQLGFEMVHVPYKGIAPAHPDLIQGRVQVMFDATAAGQAHVRAGRLRALAVTGASRMAAFPEVPTLAEQECAGFDHVGTLGLFAPAGLAAGTVAAIHAALGEVLTQPSMRSFLEQAGYEPFHASPGAYAAALRDAERRFAPLWRELGLAQD